MSESGEVAYGDTILAYTVIRSARRRKTVEITLDPREGILVAAPLDTPPERIDQVVRKRAGWIVRQASADILRPQRKEFVSGESLPYLGRQARLFVEHASVRSVTVTFDHWSFQVVAPADLDHEDRRLRIQKALTRWYRDRAGQRLPERVAYWAQRSGYTVPDVLIRDQSQRWASCSPDGVLRFNWRIVMAAPALIDYVVVHELTHLRIRTHSPAFWSELARHMPDFALRRAQLKEVGPTLMI